jgi:PHS family inorganic phosphate transporter-like MFS transporter
MGYLGDAIGRSAALKITLSCVAVGALGSSALSFGTPEATYAIIILFRLILGVGVGGVYPLSATKAAEDGGSKGAEVNSVESAKSFFWQAPGQAAAPLLGLCLARSDMPTEARWRLVMGIGAVPAAVVVLLTVMEERMKAEHAKNVPATAVKKTEASITKLPQPSIWECLQDPENVRKLIVSGGGWFLYDVCFYGMELFSPYILDDIDGDDDNVSSDDSIFEKCWRNTLAFGLGIPACACTIWLMANGYSLRSLQMYGFLLIAVCFVLLACLWAPLEDDSPETLYGIYCVLLFALSFGPNTTTFTLPATMYVKSAGVAIVSLVPGITAVSPALTATPLTCPPP